MADNPLMAALRQFEAAEANLLKLERLWDEILSLIPSGIVFGEDPEYEERSRAFENVLASLPLIDGWKPACSLPDLNGIAQDRLDAEELGMIEAKVSVETSISTPGREIREYRFRFNQKRRALIRDTLLGLIDDIDAKLHRIRSAVGDAPGGKQISMPDWDKLSHDVAQIDVLLGSSPRPPRWRELRRHLGFAQVHDLNDIEKFDWPAVKAGLRKDLYADNEPMPVTAKDLGDLVAAKPRGDVVTKLMWSNLDNEGFERLIFNLISNARGYENPDWLTRTEAPDRGRDLSVVRVVEDQLTGTRRQRLIIQCRHWQSRSVSLPDLGAIKEQMSLWGDPRVDVVIVATSGRFTTDAVQWVEKHNAMGGNPRIEMWADSHLERLLASRPGLVAQFGLRRIS